MGKELSASHKDFTEYLYEMACLTSAQNFLIYAKEVLFRGKPFEFLVMDIVDLKDEMHSFMCSEYETLESAFNKHPDYKECKIHCLFYYKDRNLHAYYDIENSLMTLCVYKDDRPLSYDDIEYLEETFCL